MQDEKKKIVDLYIPRKCSATNTLITAYDHAAVQIDVADVSIKLTPYLCSFYWYEIGWRQRKDYR